MTSQSARVPVTEQGNLTNDDDDIDDVTMNEEIVTTNVTHGSHRHDDKDSCQKKGTFDTHMVGNENDTDAVEIGSWGDTPLVQPTVIFVKPVQNGT
jgi:hypothetical protein